MAKKRAVHRVKESSLTKPVKKVAVISALLESPTTRDHLSAKGLITMSEAQKQAEINQAIVSDVKYLLTAVKGACSKESCSNALCHIFTLWRECNKEKASKGCFEIYVNQSNRIGAGIKHRKRVLNDNTFGWTEAKRKSRNNATS